VKISELSIHKVECRVTEAGYSLTELKNLMLNEDLDYTGFYERILEIKNLKCPQSEATAAYEQSVSIAKDSLFAQSTDPSTEHSTKRLKTNS